MDLRLLRYFVAVAEERNFGRAAERLQITQPPLSRAIQQLERQFGVVLFERTGGGVSLTAPGVTLYDEARALLERADQVRRRVSESGGTLTVGTLPDTGQQVGAALADVFRQHHPAATVRVREGDFRDPTVGLRSGLVDVALTWTPFDDHGLRTHPLSSNPLGVIVRIDDPLANRTDLAARDVEGRDWIRLPDDTDPVWLAYWGRLSPSQPIGTGPEVRTVHEAVQSVLWNGVVAAAPIPQELPEGLVIIPVNDQPPTRLVVAWKTGTANSLVRSFVELASQTYRNLKPGK